MYTLAWSLVLFHQVDELASVREGYAECLGLTHEPEVCQRVFAIDSVPVRASLRSWQNTAQNQTVSAMSGPELSAGMSGGRNHG